MWANSLFAFTLVLRQFSRSEAKIKTLQTPCDEKQKILNDEEILVAKLNLEVVKKKSESKRVKSCDF